MHIDVWGHLYRVCNGDLPFGKLACELSAMLRPCTPAVRLSMQYCCFDVDFGGARLSQITTLMHTYLNPAKSAEHLRLACRFNSCSFKCSRGTQAIVSGQYITRRLPGRDPARHSDVLDTWTSFQVVPSGVGPAGVCVRFSARSATTVMPIPKARTCVGASC